MIQTIYQKDATRMQTGIPGLDAVLGGGFLGGNSILLRGTPGSGKTALGLQLIANGVTLFNEPGILLSFEQFPDQLYRDALSFGWDFREMEKQGKLRIFFARRDDLYSSFAEKESVAMTQITDAAFDLQARRVLIDSASQFWQIALPVEEQRKVFFEFVMKLKGLGLTPILTSEAVSGDDDFGPEEYAIDTIVRLDHGSAPFTGGYRSRSIEIIKARGQQVEEGRHPLRILSSGVRVSPCIHLEGVGNSEERCPVGRCLTGIGDLDELLHGGVQSGTTTMIAGMTGTGKTTIAAHFLAAGLAKGEHGIFISLNERPPQLLRNMDRRGLGFSQAVADRRLTVLQASSTGMQPVEFRHVLEEAIEATGARRVVIDGLRDLLRGASTENERDYSLSLYNQLFASHCITAVCTWRVEDIAGLTSLAAIPHASAFDNIFYVGLVEMQCNLRKVIAIFKTRGEESDTALREMIITPTEIHIARLFAGLSGILMGSASGILPEAGREILEPMVRIRDFVNGAEVETPDQARLVIASIRSEFDVLAEKLRQHFSL